MSLKQVTVNGWLKDVNDNFAALGPIGEDVGLSNLRVARFEFDLGIADNCVVGAHDSPFTIPANAIIVGGFAEVNTAITGEADATLAISVQAANDIVNVAAVAGAPWSTIGRKAIIPKANTPETTSVKIGVSAKPITCTVGTAAMLTGKVSIYLYYLEGAETA